MSEAYVVAVEGLSALTSIESLPADIIKAARLAINKVADQARAEASRQIRRQVKFPANYLTGSDGRLKVTQYAKESNLAATISGRRRPTSLARFVTSSLKVGGAQRDPGVRVEVTPGSAVRLKRAFLIRLRVGNGDDPARANLGVAVRLKPGVTLTKSTGARKLGKDLWLLYGPSVDQVFINRGGTGVAKDISPGIATDLEAEFTRLLDLKL